MIMEMATPDSRSCVILILPRTLEIIYTKIIAVSYTHLEFVGLIGPNGSGKSTVLKNIYRGLTPDQGTIELDKENLLTMPYKKSALKMAVVGQERFV